MKQAIILLLFILPAYLNAQSIAENKFDKFDSVWKVQTTDIRLNGLIVSASYFDIQQAMFKTISHKYYHVSFIFVADGVTSIDEGDSKIQIEFANGKIVDYNYKGSYKILTNGDYGSMYAEINEDETDDPLFTEPIKSIRLNTKRRNYDFNVKEKKSKSIIELLQILTTEVKKGLK